MDAMSTLFNEAPLLQHPAETHLPFHLPAGTASPVLRPSFPEFCLGCSCVAQTPLALSLSFLALKILWLHIKKYVSQRFHLSREKAVNSIHSENSKQYYQIPRQRRKAQSPPTIDLISIFIPNAMSRLQAETQNIFLS